MARLKVMTKDLVPVNGLIDVIEDDESYFPLSGKGNKWYLARDPEKVDFAVKCKGREKFEKKLFVWIAISNNIARRYCNVSSRSSARLRYP